MHVNQTPNKAPDQLAPQRLPRSRRLDRPVDPKAVQLLAAFPNHNIQLVNGTVMIPIPQEDARALGLRVPGIQESRNSSLGSSSTSSRNSGCPSSSKALGKRSNDGRKSSKDLKHRRNVDTNATKKLQDLKEERRNQRTVEKLSNFHAKLERGLKNISYKTKTRRKVGSETTKTCDQSRLNPTALSGAARSLAGGKSRNSPLCQEDKFHKLEKQPSSRSMRQLFSMADSWSSDSVTSGSDNCACCHSQEPCPLHGFDFVGSP
ncbi:uncharacterized protein LOC128891184 [Hylaeus anthracinus]|uniref:uncharacterized protein LOC128891184 n=1 Tax=Hylaeus anthracinus TaxID=313031 RepID=UPI0023B95FB4|nr:uncharacterized protein LOC128891184 [Hylaeus anthracinus]